MLLQILWLNDITGTILKLLVSSSNRKYSFDRVWIFSFSGLISLKLLISWVLGTFVLVLRLGKLEALLEKHEGAIGVWLIHATRLFDTTFGFLLAVQRRVWSRLIAENWTHYLIALLRLVVLLLVLLVEVCETFNCSRGWTWQCGHLFGLLLGRYLTTTFIWAELLVEHRIVSAAVVLFYRARLNVLCDSSELFMLLEFTQFPRLRSLNLLRATVNLWFIERFDSSRVASSVVSVFIYLEQLTLFMLVRLLFFESLRFLGQSIVRLVAGSRLTTAQRVRAFEVSSRDTQLLRLRSVIRSAHAFFANWIQMLVRLRH